MSKSWFPVKILPLKSIIGIGEEPGFLPQGHLLARRTLDLSFLVPFLGWARDSD